MKQANPSRIITVKGLDANGLPYLLDENKNNLTASTFMLSLVEAQAKPAYFGRLRINFSKAGLATLGVLCFKPNFKISYQK